LSANKLVYVVGEPGVGKSTALTLLTAEYARVMMSRKPRREWLTNGKRIVATELGARAGKHPEGYPGTDAMSMTAIVEVDDWFRSGDAAREAPLVIGEGARLGVRRLVDSALHGGFDVTVVLLDDPAAAARHRAERGSKQADSWVKGARTRARNFYDYASERAETRANVRALYVANETMSETLAILQRETGL
jgi:hypothetical protein